MVFQLAMNRIKIEAFGTLGRTRLRRTLVGSALFLTFFRALCVRLLCVLFFLISGSSSKGGRCQANSLFV